MPTPKVTFQTGCTGASCLTYEGTYWDPMDDKVTVSFFHHGQHVVTVVFADWDEAGREGTEFLDKPDEWIRGHFQSLDDNGRPVPRGPSGRPPFHCPDATFYIVLGEGQDRFPAPVMDAN